MVKGVILVRGGVNLFVIDELERLRREYIGKKIWGRGNQATFGFSAYDSSGGRYHDAAMKGWPLEIVDVVSSWSPNSMAPLRVIARDQGGAEGFIDLDPARMEKEFAFDRPKPAPRQPGPPPLTEEQQRERARSTLELLSFSWSTTGGYATAQGEVLNLSSAPIRRLQAVAIFRDASGGLITSDTALIEFEPLLPGQKSPFKVVSRYNPEMKTCEVHFRLFAGSTVPTFQR